MQKLYYISSSIFPSNAANSVQVIKMCEEFSKKYKVTLYGICDIKKKVNVDEVFDIYGCKKVFELDLLSTNRNFVYSIIIFLKLIFKTNSIFYSRNYFVSALLKLAFKRNVFFEVHTDPVNSPFYNTYLKFVVKYFGLKLISISESLKLICSKYYNIPKDRIFVSHDAADAHKFKMDINPIKSNQKINVGYIGSIYPGRGVEIICELALLNPLINFNIIGGNNDLTNKLKNKYKCNNLKFTGHIPYSNIQNYFKDQHILLGPWQNKIGISGGAINTVDYMSPLKLFEYMASKRAIIISDLPALREVIDEKSAILVSADNLEDWDRELKSLVKDKIRYIKLIESAYKLFLNNYTIKIRVKNINNFING
jgi:glycosyltransferase involved in cell wall biosynthesis